MARKRKPRLIDKHTELRFFAEDGAFHEVASIEAMNSEGKLVRSFSKNPRPAGVVSGSTLYINMPDGRQNAARIAWLNHYGEVLPLRTRIKHLDGDIWNNKKENLAIAPRNAHHAITRIAGQVVSLGRFSTREESLAAIDAARAIAGMPPVDRKEGTS